MFASVSPFFAAVLAALVVTRISNGHCQPTTLPFLSAFLVLADLSRLTGLWPCDVACQGGAHYQTVAGVSVVWFALVAHLSLTWLALRDLRHGTVCAWTVRLCWLIGGVAAFFLIVAHQLDISCSYCRLSHVGAFLAIITANTVANVRETRWWQRCSWALAGWLIANAVFHHTPIADVSAPPSGTTPTVTQPLAGDAALLARIDAGRTRGRADAPATLELALDLHCASCAKLHGPLMAALAPAIADGRLKVVIRLVVRKSHPAGRAAAHLVLAAASAGEHETVLAILLDSNPQSQSEGLRARVAEDLAIAPIDAVVDGYVPVLDRVIADDAARLAALKVGIKTPTAVLLRDGREIGRWSGDFAPAVVVDALGR